MSFHGHYRTDEPPDGDYAGYIESLLGGPPDDVERAAAELAQRLASRQPLAKPLDLTAAPKPSGPHGAGSRPDRPVQPATAPGAAGAGAMRVATAAGMSRQSLPSLRRRFSRLLVFAGAALVALGIIAPVTASLAPGFILLLAGFAMNLTGRPAARPRSDTT